jgi:hypothetical protein
LPWPPADGSPAVNYVEDPPAGQLKRNLTVDAHNVAIADIRGREAEFADLDWHGFAAVTGVAPSAERDFCDDASIRSHYYPEVEQLLRAQIPGATRVVIFDHTIRRAGPGARRGAVLAAHVDQTARSAAQRVRRHVADAAAAEDLLAHHRYRIVNVWRTLNAQPVEASPLAYASSASFRDEDALPVEHRYPPYDGTGYTGQTAAVAHHPDQRWYYWSGMTGSERLLLECFDSEALKGPESGVQGGRTPHTAFVDPRTRPEAEGRESIEVRTLVFGP